MYSDAEKRVVSEGRWKLERGGRMEIVKILADLDTLI